MQQKKCLLQHFALFYTDTRPLKPAMFSLLVK